ncbi:MAG: hypothetical protein JJU37_06385 [Balneolaceae bacterium]|nr:hypothetical protein [Balneolaceae bacterium]
MSTKASSNYFMASLKNAFNLLQDGYYSVFFKEFKNRLYSESFSFGLQRDLSKPFEAPSAKITLKIRPIKDEDIDIILEDSGLVNPRIIASQRAILEAKIPTCYVAVTASNTACYMQWLIGNKDNDKIKSHFKNIFPTLKPQEALLEGAYGNPEFRGLGIMPAAMAKIAEKASLTNVRWVNTFVDITNIASLKGCRRSGFEPYVLRKEKWVLFNLSVSFHPLPENLIADYLINTAEKSGKSLNGLDVNNQLKPQTLEI